MVARWHLLSNRLRSNNEKREREREGKKPKVIPVVLVAQEAHRESGFLFDAVMKTGQSGSVAWTHQRMTAVQSWMRQQARRKP